MVVYCSCLSLSLPDYSCSVASDGILQRRSQLRPTSQWASSFPYHCKSISLWPQTSATTRCYSSLSGVFMTSALKRFASTILQSSGSSTRSAKVTRRLNFSFLASTSSCWVQ